MLGNMQPYEQLESDFGEWAGVENCVACSSGTAALHLSLEAMDLPPGSRVILSEFNMIACARAVVLAGLKPVFVDCDDRLLIDVEKCHKLAEHGEDGGYDYRISAILAVHIYGRRVDVQRIHDLKSKYGGDLAIIEDCAEFHGGELYVEEYGYSDSHAWSYYSNKVICGAEGGLVSFTDPKHAEKAKSLRTLGFTEAHDFLHIPRGHNYRMSNLHAAPILESLANADDNLIKRRQVEEWYNELIPEKWHMPPRDVVWVYDLRVPKLEWDRMGIVVKRLNAQGIAARHGFKPMSVQPEFRQSNIKDFCPNA